jgi:hypothetical protein
MTTKRIYTSFGVRPGDYYKAFQRLPLACNVPTEVSSEVLATAKPPRTPLVPYQSFLTWLASRDRYSSDTTCHTSVLRNETEASVHVSRIFRSHVQ